MKYAAVVLLVLTIPVFSAPQAAQTVSASSFVGTWVGTQSWAIDSPSPSAMEEQPVELNIELVNGHIIGFMKPWFGGSEGATFIEASVAGEELRASAVVGKPPAPGARGRRGDWKSGVAIAFNFKNDGKESLAGTADVTLDGVKWLKFKYKLGKKRSRY